MAIISSKNFTVIIDACVLYPADLRDLLMQLALEETYKARWTQEIHEEWIRNVNKNNPQLTIERLNKTARMMNTRVPDPLIENYQGLIQSLTLPDEQDRHVLAAAIKAQAQVIVTCNLKDFPAEELQKYNIEAQHPNTFAEYLINLSPEKVINAVKAIHKRLKNPPKTIDELIEIYRQRELEGLCSFLQKNSDKFN